MPIRLVLADGHPLILYALENLFRGEPDIDVMAFCRDGIETLRAVRRHQPDVLILDIHLPRKDGLAVFQVMRRERRSTRVVVLTAGVNDGEALELMRLGVNGIVLKDMDPPLLVQCTRKVHAGGTWVERSTVCRVINKLTRHGLSADERFSALTAREGEIVRLAASGLHSKKIGKELHICEGTVKVHLHNIYDKLRLDGRVALLLYARERGLV